MIGFLCPDLIVYLRDQTCHSSTHQTHLLEVCGWDTAFLAARQHCLPSTRASIPSRMVPDMSLCSPNHSMWFVNLKPTSISSASTANDQRANNEMNWRRKTSKKKENIFNLEREWKILANVQSTRQSSKEKTKRKEKTRRRRALTGETFLVLLYVQLKRICSAGSASTSHRTSIECILIEPTDVCSVPGLQRGASEKVKRANREQSEGWEWEQTRIDIRQFVWVFFTPARMQEETELAK